MHNILIPIRLEDFIINRDIALKLLRLNKLNIGNLLFYGNQNSGKKTLVKSLINHIYNTDINLNRILNSYELKIGNNKVNIDYISSQYHIEVNLYEYGLYDKNILSTLIDNYVRYENISKNLKCVVFHHFENSSSQAQIMLKKLIDIPNNNTIFILLSEQICKINRSLLTRFLHIRVPKPEIKTITNYVDKIIHKNYKISKINRQKLITATNNNLFCINKIYEDLETNKKIDFKQINIIEDKLNEIIKYIKKKDISSIIVIRKLSYSLLLINITMNYILKFIFNYFLNSKDISEENKWKMIQDASYVETKQSNIEHDIICLEFFILKVKKLLLNN